MSDWSPDPTQQRVLDEARAWLDDPNADQLKYLAGFAGTGKTTIAKYLVQGRSARFCAYTGKAALVLRDKGCSGATTIHRLIYRPVREEQQQEELDTSAPWDELVAQAKRNVEIQKKAEIRSPKFELCPDSDLALNKDDIDVVVADECSMISDEVARDLMSFGIKILVLGDPAQLPPVNGRGAFSNLTPTWLLTQVHRQARESGVLRLATDVREGRGVDPTPGAYGGDVAVTSHHAFQMVDPREILSSVNQILVGTNAARHTLNQWARRALGHQGESNPLYPVPGDKLVCLRNDHRNGFMNGGQWTVLRARFERDSYSGEHLNLKLESLDEPGLTTWCTVWPHHFQGNGEMLKRMQWRELREHQEFDYAYAMTVHKSQGSAWPCVMVLDESHVFGADAPRHLYTAVTRAAKQLVLVR